MSADIVDFGSWITGRKTRTVNEVGHERPIDRNAADPIDVSYRKLVGRKSRVRVKGFVYPDIEMLTDYIFPITEYTLK